MNPHKAKGDRAERTARDFYRLAGFPGTERTRAGYPRDAGDLHLSPGTIAQIKNCRVPRWTEWLVQLAEQKREARADVAWLVVKRPGLAVADDWLAVMTVAEHAELVRRAGYGTPLDELDAGVLL
jgi:hypothetical protein